MSAPAAVIFDLDGVLIDSRGPIAACTNRTLVLHGLEPREPTALLA